MNTDGRWNDHGEIAMPIYLKADFWRVALLVFTLLLFFFCACTMGDPSIASNAATGEETVDDADSEESSLGNQETIRPENSKADHPVDGIAKWADAVYLAAEAAAQVTKDVPKLWIECSPNKEVQARYGIMEENACKTTGGVNSYNQFISRVLYEYLQKNESGEERRLVETFNGWYSKMAKRLQTIKEDERKEYLNNVSIEYIKPITTEIERKFVNECEYTQYIYTNARFMFHFYNAPSYRSEIQGVSYSFTTRGTRCMQLYALPVGKKNTIQNSTILTLNDSEDLYYKECVESFTFTYKNNIYYLLINGFDKVEHPEAKGVLYRLEDDRLNLKSICPIM